MQFKLINAILFSFIPFLLLTCYYAFPIDELLTGDSMEYLARRYTSPLHPHHLLWVYILDLGQKPIQFLTSWDRVRSAQIFLVLASAYGVLAFGLLLWQRARLSPLTAAAWAGLFGSTAGYSVLAQETESYNVAIALCLTSALALPERNNCIRGVVVWRFLAAIILYALAVCLHQLFVLAAIPFFFYFWRPGFKISKSGIAFVGMSGVLCLTAYLVSYGLQSYKIGFWPWLTLYSGQMPLFGKAEHFTTPYFVHRLIANLLAALAYDPVPVIKANNEQGLGTPLAAKLAIAIGYMLWLTLWAFAFIGVFSKKPLYRFFASWYILFETFLWYWAPWLLQMQVLIMPAIVGVLACAIDQILEIKKPWEQRLSPIVFPVILIVSILLCRLIQMPRVGHLSFDEAKEFYNRYPQVTDDKHLMILYEYSGSWPYLILAEKKVRNIAIIEDGAPAKNLELMRTTALRRAIQALESGKTVVLHQSMLLDIKTAGMYSFISTLNDSGEFEGTNIRLIKMANDRPIAVRLFRSEDSKTSATSAQIQAIVEELNALGSTS